MAMARSKRTFFASVTGGVAQVAKGWENTQTNWKNTKGRTAGPFLPQCLPRAGFLRLILLARDNEQPIAACLVQTPQVPTLRVSVSPGHRFH
jgi:hypothetical protein